MEHPLKGPQVGANVGPKVQNTIAIPLFSSGTMSAMDPAPSVMGHDPAIPAKRRRTIKAARLLARAQPMLKSTKRVLQTL